MKTAVSRLGREEKFREERRVGVGNIEGEGKKGEREGERGKENSKVDSLLVGRRRRRGLVAKSARN